MNIEFANTVIEFASSGRLLNPNPEFIERFPSRVESFNTALMISRLSDDEVIEPNYRSLSRIFSQAESRIRDVVYSRRDWRVISQLETETFAQLEKSLDRMPKHFLDAADDILAHLSICWLSRLIGEDSFFERVFEAYAFGFWPCGWLEADDQSDIIVFISRAAAS
jgi:hypothetical protein